MRIQHGMTTRRRSGKKKNSSRGYGMPRREGKKDSRGSSKEQSRGATY